MLTLLSRFPRSLVQFILGLDAFACLRDFLNSSAYSTFFNRVRWLFLDKIVAATRKLDLSARGVSQTLAESAAR